MPSAKFDTLNSHPAFLALTLIGLAAIDRAGNQAAQPFHVIEDTSAPTVTMQVPEVAHLRFWVSWLGQDAASAVRDYDVQYKVGISGTWTSWLTHTSQTQAPFVGERDQSYYFRVRATDHVNNASAWVEAGPVTVSAVTKYYMFGFRAAWWWVSGQVARPDSGSQLRVRGTSTSIREGECGMKTKNKTYVQIGDKAFKADGKYLVCNDIRTGEECFRKAFSHPRYETLKDLSISEVHASPDGKDIILLFALSSPGYKTVGNLARVATTGDVLWWAELTDTGRDTYVAVKTNGGRIVAQSWDGYSCEIDPKTGRILSKKFVK